MTTSEHWDTSRQDFHQPWTSKQLSPLNWKLQQDQIYQLFLSVVRRFDYFKDGVDFPCPDWAAGQLPAVVCPGAGHLRQSCKMLEAGHRGDSSNQNDKEWVLWCHRRTKEAGKETTLIKVWLVPLLWQLYTEAPSTVFNEILLMRVKLISNLVSPGVRPVETHIAGFGQEQHSSMAPSLQRQETFFPRVWALGPKSFWLYEGQIFPTSPSEGDQTCCPAGMCYCISTSFNKHFKFGYWLNIVDLIIKWMTLITFQLSHSSNWRLLRWHLQTWSWRTWCQSTMAGSLTESNWLTSAWLIHPDPSTQVTKWSHVWSLSGVSAAEKWLY